MTDHQHVSEKCPRCGFPRCGVCHCEFPTGGVMDFNCSCSWPDPRVVTASDKIIQAVCDDLKKRSEVGIKKYGVTLERKDLTLVQWLEHAYEETLDQANYLKRAIMEIRGEM